MTAVYPGAIKAFSARTNGVDIVSAADINTAYDEITAIERYNGTVIYKTADEIVNNSNVLQNDDVLIVPVEVNGVYRFDMAVFINSANQTSDFQYHFTVPSGCTMIFADTFSTAGVGGVPNLSYIETATNYIGSNTGTWMLYLTGVIFNGANAGYVTFQWAQATANATDTKVLKGSNIKYYRMA